MKTRDVINWHFSTFDLVILGGLMIAGLVVGVVDRIRGNT